MLVYDYEAVLKLSALYICHIAQLCFTIINNHGISYADFMLSQNASIACV